MTGDIQTVKRSHSLSLLSKMGVLGVGIGRKVTAGRPSETQCISVLVTRKLPRSVVSGEDLVPEELDGFLTDIIPAGSGNPMMRAFLRESPLPGDVRTARHRPAPGGVSVGHYLSNGAGTLGGWIPDPTTGKPLLLSCWHVIANMGRCKKGDPVLQPAPIDGGRMPDDIIAYLDRWIDVEMLADRPSLRTAKARLKELLAAGALVPTNSADVAVARPVSDEVVSYEVLELGEIRVSSSGEGIADLGIGDQVVKSGRSTGVTQGRVNLVDLDVLVTYRIGVALFVDQIGVENPHTD